MDNFGGPNGGQIPVSLIGKDDVVGNRALDASGNGRRAAMGRLNHVAAEIVVGHNGAANGGDADGLTRNAQLVQGFGDQTVNNSMGADRKSVV